MSTNLKCRCGAYYEPDMCPVCQEERWIEEIDALRARVAELQGREIDAIDRALKAEALLEELRAIAGATSQDPRDIADAIRSQTIQEVLAVLASIPTKYPHSIELQPK